MNYMWILRLGLIPYYVLAVLIILFFALQKDKYTVPGTIFDDQQWNLYDVLIWIFLFFVSHGVIFTIFLFLQEGPFFRSTLFWTLNTLSFYIVFKFRIKKSLSIFGLSKGTVLKDVFYGLKIILIPIISFYILLFLIPRPELFEGGIDERLILYKNNTIAVLFLLMISTIIGPILEELISRGLMYSPFRRKAGKWGAIFLTSTIFALLHGIFFSLPGLILAYMYEKRKSLIPSIVAHIFVNLTGTITFFYLKDFFGLGYKVNFRSYAGVMSLIFLSIFLLISFIGTEQEKVVVAEKSSEA